MIKKIIIGCDHLGRELKDSIKEHLISKGIEVNDICLLYTSPSPRDATLSRMPSSA